ncbi:Methyl-accepting chemotaxis protein [Vibrio ichthyoenteri ATCC 700023]|uniref:Methyl-accepting chemotaxis protein n=1 Tax=Vibrio ichthyoenteri ATCC 700023 TaxID=870968 RepID=F9RXM1_9VIBR|nr:methyl-accepting chemotaxis protein [Vibrio ichthyoenteri]EGU47801.1 Methyl-accepting chemotaxis protein [Vibrio ichthyoenteri ATCC 700023]
MSALSIKTKLTIAFVSAVLIMTAAQTYLTGRQILDETQRSTTQYGMTLLEENVSSMNNWLAAKITVVNAAAGGFKENGDVESYLSYLTKAGDFQIVYAGLDTGQFLQGVPLIDATGFDPRTRPWYKDAIAAGQMQITEPYVDIGTQKLVVSIAKPFNTAGIKGVLGADVEINALVSDIVESDQQGVFGFLVNSQGHIVAHANSDLTLKDLNRISPDLTMSKIIALSTSDELQALSISDVDSLVASRKVPNTDWYYTIVVDKEHAFQSHQSLVRQSLVMGLIQVLVIALISLLIVKKALAPLNSLSESMQDLSQGNGDLTKRIKVETQDEIGLLAGHVNAFIAKLQEVVTDISQSSNSIDDQSKLSTRVATKISDGLSVQLNEVSQIATAVHEMSAAAEEVAGNARLTADSAFGSTEHCDQGKLVIKRNQESITNLASQLQHASETIGELERNSKEINAILSTISDIAEQTNLLALNAAIEAARAGEQGRGFAVVADEVRVLSQRTHSSTVEIREMIESLQRNSHEAVESMNRSQALASSSVEDANDATDALEKITISIQEISDMAMQISNAASEQRTVTEEISKNIQQANDVSNHLSQEADSSRTIAEDLEAITMRLNRQVQMFKH